MTREELYKIAKRYAQDELKDSHSAVEDVVAAAFLNGIDYFKHNPRWISVEDELPKGFAIITNGDDVLIGKYNFEKGLWGVRNKTMFAYTLLPANWNVTHWMQISPPPILSKSGNTGKKGGEK